MRVFGNGLPARGMMVLLPEERSVVTLDRLGGAAAAVPKDLREPAPPVTPVGRTGIVIVGNEDIDWKAYYEAEPQVSDFDPSSDAIEIHRCKAAWSVFPRGRIESVLDVGCGDSFFCQWISGRTGAN